MNDRSLGSVDDLLGIKELNLETADWQVDAVSECIVDMRETFRENGLIRKKVEVSDAENPV